MSVRANVSPGTSVEVIQKQDQRTGRLTSGTVSRLLTNSGFHPRGIKVRTVIPADRPVKKYVIHGTGVQYRLVVGDDAVRYRYFELPGVM